MRAGGRWGGAEKGRLTGAVARWSTAPGPPSASSPGGQRPSAAGRSSWQAAGAA